MNHHIDISGDIDRLLASGRVNDALDLIDNAASTLGIIAEINSATTRLRESYRLMTHYALQGLPDPSRPQLFAELCGSVRSLADDLHRRSRIADAPTLYFNTLRYQLNRRDLTVAALVGEYHRVNRRLQMAMLTEDVEKAGRELTARSESLEKEIFNFIWTTSPLSVDDAATIGNVIADPSLPRHFKLLCIAAVMMGELEYHDERRLRLLMDAYTSDDTEISVRALCSLLIVMSVRRDRPFSPSLSRRFDSLREEPRWHSDVRMAFMQFIRARDTERIGRKLTDEVIPEMMKLRPEIEKLGKMPLDPEAMEENPEWAELLDKSGISDKLKELQEIQEDGGDVMMVTFSNLKTFPFFNDISNWFLPFHSSHSAVGSSSDSTVRILGEIMDSAPMFCDGDKYSIIFSLAQVPSAQRELMASQLKANSAQMAAMSFGDLSHSQQDRERIARRYVQDIYRFFRLFRRKGEFHDPFAVASSLNLVTLPQLSEIFDDADTLRLVGEFYFKHRYYADAFDLFDRLSFKTPPSAELFQKMGYCMQMSGNLAEAIRFYEQSELLNSQSEWTVKRLAFCHRQNGDWEKALSYYLRVEPSHSDDSSLALNIGRCHMLCGRYEEALKYFYKVEFLSGESDRSSRPIVRCSLLSGDLERVRRYSDLILGRDPSASDFLAAGHLEVLSGNMPMAVERYASSIAARNFDRDDFMRDFESDRHLFETFPAPDRLTLGLLLDDAFRRASELGHSIG